MKYIPVEKGEWIEYNPLTKRSRVIILDELNKQEQFLTEEIARINPCELSVEEKAKKYDEIVGSTDDYRRYNTNVCELQQLQELKSKLI